MKISRNSWHYKLESAIWNSTASNLCQYFWRVVLATILSPLILIGKGFVCFLDLMTDWSDDRARRKATRLSDKEVFTILLDKYGNVSEVLYKFSFYYNLPNVIKRWVQLHDDDSRERINKQIELYKSESNLAPKKHTIKKAIATYNFYIVAIYLLLTFGGIFTFFNHLPSGNMGMFESLAGCVLFTLMSGMFFVAPILFSGEARQKFVNRYKQPIEDDLTGSYLKAVKGKMCPLIEWTD